MQCLSLQIQTMVCLEKVSHGPQGGTQPCDLQLCQFGLKEMFTFHAEGEGRIVVEASNASRLENG